MKGGKKDVDWKDAVRRVIDYAGECCGCNASIALTDAELDALESA